MANQWFYPTEHTLHLSGADSDSIDTWTDQVMDELCETEGVVDPDLTANLATGEVVFTFAVQAEQHADVFDRAVALMKDALDAVDAHRHWKAVDVKDRSATVHEAEPIYA